MESENRREFDVTRNTFDHPHSGDPAVARPNEIVPSGEVLMGPSK